MAITRPDIDDLRPDQILEPGETLDNPLPSFADEAARLAYIPIAADTGKMWVQESPASVWILLNHSPVEWKDVGQGAAGHDRAHSLTDPLDHSDVDGTPADGDVLQYSASSGKWEPQPAGSASFDTLIITTDGGIVYDLSGEFVVKG